MSRGERRALRTEYPVVDDDMIIEVSVEAGETPEYEDLTQIRELVKNLDPANEIDQIDETPALIYG